MSQPAPGWAQFASDSLLPGAHAVVLGDEFTCIEARLARFEVRDTLAIVSHGPTVRFAFLFRKPGLEATITEQLMVTGTGALHTDACRVSAESADPRGTVRQNRGGGMNTTQWRTGAAASIGSVSGSSTGRWPSNVVFVHGPECWLVGERRITGHKGYPNGPGGSSSQFSQKGTRTTRTSAWAGHADSEGKETVPEWACQRGCPVTSLNAQSGFSQSVSTHRGERHGNVYGGGKGPSGPNTLRGHEDAGGASRFYPQFKDDAELTAWFERLVVPV